MRDTFLVLWIVLVGFIKQDECNLASDSQTNQILQNSSTLENIDSACDQEWKSSACPCFERNFKIN